MKTKVKSIGLFLSLLVITMNMAGQMDHKMEMKNEINKSVCVLEATQGNNVSGTITFTSTSDGILVKGDIHGLTPGKHGFHIHELGDCSAVDGTSAGGHFNPSGMPHGAPMDMKRHEGDMGNIEADATGNAHIEYTDKMISFSGTNSIIGRGVIVHKDADDLKTQPTGNAGARVACGVIGIAK